MKKSIITFIMLLTWITAAIAIDPAYEKAMTTQLENLRKASSEEDYRAVANAFARIGEMNEEAWLPQYYAGLALTNMSFRINGKIAEKDAILNKANEHVVKAAQISPSNSEIVALEGFVMMAKLSVDPQSRGQSLSPKVMQTYGKAIELDKNNPRALVLMAQMEQGMAQFFGQGPEKACGLARISQDLFKKEAQKEKENILEPTWGREIADQLVKICN